MQLGYSLPKYGADGSYGNETMTAVINFQRDNGLDGDGVCGPRTWEALDRSEPMKLYTVYIPHLPLYKAEAFVAAYGGAYMSEEEGGGI
jgi:peptidoglycan hydrolase-like protein with peptidoglycan-binding domain